MKICLIGSTRFRKKYEELNLKLTLAGHVVYTVTCFPRKEDNSWDGDAITEEEKELLDLVHLQKILESDSVVIVTDHTGYVGYSTKREILWAKMLKKRVHSSQFLPHIHQLLTQFDRQYPVSRA